MATGIAAGVGGAVAAAAGINMMPIVDNRSKALAAVGIGVVAYMMLPKRNRMLKAAAIGATLGGALSLTKQMFPQIPMMAGAEPLGVNVRPTLSRRPSYAQRQIGMRTAERAAVTGQTQSVRNVSFGGAGSNAIYGKFLTARDVM